MIQQGVAIRYALFAFLTSRFHIQKKEALPSMETNL